MRCLYEGPEANTPITELPPCSLERMALLRGFRHGQSHCAGYTRTHEWCRLIRRGKSGSAGTKKQPLTQPLTWESTHKHLGPTSCPGYLSDALWHDEAASASDVKIHASCLRRYTYVRSTPSMHWLNVILAPSGAYMPTADSAQPTDLQVGTQLAPPPAGDGVVAHPSRTIIKTGIKNLMTPSNGLDAGTKRQHQSRSD